jgi:hypothetical protein
VRPRSDYAAGAAGDSGFFTGLRLAAAFFFFAEAFLRADFFTAFLADFLAAPFLAALLRAVFFAADFLAVDFLAAFFTVAFAIVGSPLKDVVDESGIHVDWRLD